MLTEEFFQANAKGIELIARAAHEAERSWLVYQEQPTPPHWSALSAGAQYAQLQAVKAVLSEDALPAERALFAKVAQVTADHMGMVSARVALKKGK